MALQASMDSSPGEPARAVHTVIIGAGIVGCSIAHHLAERGFTDVLLVDRAQPGVPDGSTGHAPGLLAQISASPVLTLMAQRSVALYRRLPPARPAYSAVGSIEVARDEATMRRFRDKVRRAAAAGIEAQMLDVAGLHRLMPLMNTQSLVGGVFVPSDGVLDARRALAGLAESITQAGIEIRGGTTVTGIEMQAGQVRAMLTDRGRIACERVVVAVGIWGAALLKRTLGVDIPLVPVQHPYVTSEPLPEWQGETEEATHPLVRDIDNVVYYRQHGARLGYGWYSHAPLTADMGALPRAELPYDAAAFQPTLNLDLFPFLAHTPVAQRLNGVFSMTPDGLPLLGPLDGFGGLWLAEAVWVTHAGGFGQVAAELLLDGRSALLDADEPFDANRFTTADPHPLQDRSLALYNDIYHWPAVSASSDAEFA